MRNNSVDLFENSHRPTCIPLTECYKEVAKHVLHNNANLCGLDTEKFYDEITTDVACAQHLFPNASNGTNDDSFPAQNKLFLCNTTSIRCFVETATYVDQNKASVCSLSETEFYDNARSNVKVCQYPSNDKAQIIPVKKFFKFTYCNDGSTNVYGAKGRPGTENEPGTTTGAKSQPGTENEPGSKGGTAQATGINSMSLLFVSILLMLKIQTNLVF